MFIFILLIFFCFTPFIGAHSLVLIHIGDDLPTYVSDGLAQVRLFNPHCDIYLISNKKALHTQLPLLQKYCVTPVVAEDLTKTKEHEQFINGANFYNNFWRYTSERFLYLNDFMQQYDICDLFHCENDIMIYVDFDELVPILKAQYSGIAAVFDSDNRCIPGIMFIPNKIVMGLLGNYFGKQVTTGKNDMEIIAEFRKISNKNIIDGLPIICNEYIKQYGLKNDLRQTAANPWQYSQYIDEFSSVFDGAAIGQYLGGTIFDHLGPGFINETCFFNPSLLSYEWIPDNQGRKIPYFKFNDKKYRINNLHIHSKKLSKFASK